MLDECNATIDCAGLLAGPPGWRRIARGRGWSSETELLACCYPPGSPVFIHAGLQHTEEGLNKAAFVLLDRGASPMAVGASTQVTPLFMASINGNSALVQRMLRAPGVDVKQPIGDGSGLSPLSAARKYMVNAEESGSFLAAKLEPVVALLEAASRAAAEPCGALMQRSRAAPMCPPRSPRSGAHEGERGGARDGANATSWKGSRSIAHGRPQHSTAAQSRADHSGRPLCMRCHAMPCDATLEATWKAKYSPRIASPRKLVPLAGAAPPSTHTSGSACSVMRRVNPLSSRLRAGGARRVRVRLSLEALIAVDGHVVHLRAYEGVYGCKIG